MDCPPCSWARQCQAVPRLSVKPIRVFVEVVPFVVELEVAVPRLIPASR